MPLQGYWWPGRDNAIVTETTSSRVKCPKTRTLSPRTAVPPVGCIIIPVILRDAVLACLCCNELHNLSVWSEPSSCVCVRWDQAPQASQPQDLGGLHCQQGNPPPGDNLKFLYHL